MELPFDVIKTILTIIPESQRYFCRLVSKAWLAWVDTSVTQIDLSKRKILEIMTDSCDFPVIKPNAERISKAERVLMMAARRFTNLKKVKLGAEPKSVRTTYIALPAILKTEDERSDLHPVHPLMESFNKKRALDDFAPILQDVNEAINRHKDLSANLLWNDLSLKRVRDDIDPMIIVHLVKNCPKLTELNLYGITRVTDDILAAIVDLRPNITQLNLINTSVSVLGLEYALNKLPNLENLTIGRTISSGYILCQPHRNFPANEMLKLKDLDVWKRLRKLRLSYFSLNDMTPLFSECTNLVKFHDVGVHATVLPFKTTFPKLTSLDVEVSSFDVETFIAKHPQLEDISLRGLVTSAHINAITNNVIKLTKLRISVYWEAEISTESMRALLQKHAKTMKSLELCEIRTIDPDVLDFKFPALKTLVVKLCSKISGSHVAKLVPRKVGNIEYSDCIQKLLTMDVSKLEENGSYANFQYYDEKNDFNLRTTIGSPCDPAWW